MTKGTIRIMHQGVPYSTPKIDKERATTLDKVLKKLNKKNIKIVSTYATDTHTIINYEVY